MYVSANISHVKSFLHQTPKPNQEKEKCIGEALKKCVVQENENRCDSDSKTIDLFAHNKYIFT